MWARLRMRLRAEFGEDVFTSWLARLELASIEDGQAHLTVPTKFLKSWISGHYLDRMCAMFVAEEAGVDRVVLSVRVAGQRPVTVRTQRPAPAVASSRSAAAPAPAESEQPGTQAARERPVREAPTHADDLAGSPLDKRYTFTSFHVGTSNALAHAAALQVARTTSSELPVYNPLYLHASVGLGKTHLCQAVAHAAAEGGRNVIYLTAERFMHGFVAALRTQTAHAFKEHLRGIDVLVIDDVQFLTGKSIQQEFGHTINALIDAGKQVVVAADRAPTDIDSLEERVRSRLKAGLVLEIGALDADLRLKILEARVAAARVHLSSFEVKEDVLGWLARQLTANGRDLEGAVNRLLAHATLTGATVDLATAEAAIKDLIRNREPKKVKIEDIQRLVANHYNVSRSDILSSRRTATVVRPRQIAMYLSKALTLRSLPEIGRRFGGRDHTTVLHAVRKIEDLSHRDQALAGELDLLKRMLQE
jgi:chromosomal replication initiator protein